MALIKCSECGGTVSDKAATCPHCGAPVEVPEEVVDEKEQNDGVEEPEKTEKESVEKPKKSKKKLIIILAIIAAAIIAAVIAIQVTADKEAPVISGIEKGEVIDVTCGTDFNLNDYIAGKIKISDNKDGDIKSYTVSADKKVYDKKTGKVDTQQVGEYPVTITAQDQAENQVKVDCNLKLNPIHITKDNRTPLIYDGEYAKIELESLKHGHIYDKDEYNFIFKYTNRTENQLDVYLRSSYTYINDMNVSAYYTVTGGIKPGKTGKAECDIYDEEIPEEVKDFKQIESAVGMGMPDEKCIYTIPIIIDRDAFK